MKFEPIKEPLASRKVFLERLGLSLTLAATVVITSLAAGMVGYRHFGPMGWVDAFANATMILSGMGPLRPLETNAGKIFEGLYALYSGFVVLAVAGLVLAPVLHRFLHQMHLDEEDERAN